MNLSYLKTVYKICIFFRDIAFFIVIVAIPVFFRLIKILINLRAWCRLILCQKTPTVIPCNRDPVPQYSKLSVSNTSINLYGLSCLIMLVSINMFKTLLQPTAVYNEKLRIASNGFHLLGYLKFVNLPNVIDFVSEY